MTTAALSPHSGSSPPGLSTQERVRGALGLIPHSFVVVRDGTTTLSVSGEHLQATLARLRDAARFESATFVTAIDHDPAEPRFELVHQLHSLAHNDRVRVKTRLDGRDPKAPTCTGLWPGAAYMERECFDMFGIVFEGHADLKRLLMPEEFAHFPLRKDFPHHGIEPDRLYREWDRARRAQYAAHQPSQGSPQSAAVATVAQAAPRTPPPAR